MSERGIRVGDTVLRPPNGGVEGGPVTRDGEPFYRLQSYDRMAPFLMTLVSDADHWLFISSNGALTAGRRDPDRALFPYETDDRIHDSVDLTGGKTILHVARGAAASLWEPFSPRFEGVWRLSRALEKSAYGNRVIFEERNHDLGVLFSAEWTTSDRFGFVRRCEARNEGSSPVTLTLLDGIQNVMPDGLSRRFHAELSTLADAYRESELETETGLVLFRLSSIPTDKAEPSESLRATAAWSRGLPSPRVLLCSAQVDAFRMGAEVREETMVRGRRGAFLLASSFALAPGESRSWLVVADVHQDAADVATTRALLRGGSDLAGEVARDVARGTASILAMVAGSDGLSLTDDTMACRRHFSNTLFNIMRGGVPDHGMTVTRADFADFLAAASRRVARLHDPFVRSLSESLSHGDLVARAAEVGDPHLERLAREYLPLAFSRRHGDPSRPWNSFAIELKDERGRRVRSYQGNWRDIFQNWEALGLSFPGYIESMIFKFLDASTADGYNPYRVTREGFDWEVIDPDDPWSFIGYWGDHQVVYLLKLLELSRRHHPGVLEGLLRRRLFTFANVPYRIASYERLLADPWHTIEFDAALHAAIGRRAAEEGTEAKYLMDSDGVPCRASLAEKLLLVALTKLCNFIPEAGIWMNTQRPEWNDANNALVGNGVSVVTLCYLRRFLVFVGELAASAGEEDVPVSAETYDLLQHVQEALRDVGALLHGALPGRERRAFLDRVGAAGSVYRGSLYGRGFSGSVTLVSPSVIREFCAAACAVVDHSVRANRRPDGLYHAYNVMSIGTDGQVHIRRLDEMLEGQVAALSSGVLSAQEAVRLLDALRSSRLYRQDQDSYVLYPDRRAPRFRDRNIVPSSLAAGSALLTAMIEQDERSIVARDVDGIVHFNAGMRNAAALRSALRGLAGGPFGPLAAREESSILGLYEQVFDHESFTGRSGTFYKYEGLGCVYWHMVSKLLLAVQEAMDRALDASEDSATCNALRSHYRAIREGIGVHKPPERYGAIPTDPYSHTPGFAGAQQPGMTGQVKEDIITRRVEMGARIVDGCLCFRGELCEEWLATSADFSWIGADGSARSIPVPAGCTAFTLCQVPVILHCGGGPRITVTRVDGSWRTVAGLRLDRRASSSLFDRAGEIDRLDVFLGNT